MDLLTPIDYDKLSDTVLFLGSSTTLNFHVGISTKNQLGERSGFHKEFEYDSKYENVDRARNIKREFDYYLTLDRWDREFGKDGIMIRAQDMILFKNAVSNIIQLYETAGVYAVKKNELVVVKRPGTISVSGLANNRVLTFDFIVIQWDEHSPQTPGVRIGFSDTNYSDITLDRMYALHYILDTFNMYQAASNLVNYLGRPTLGTNKIEFENDWKPKFPEEQKEENAKKEEVSGKHRTPGAGKKVSNKGYSIFDQ